MSLLRFGFKLRVSSAPTSPKRTRLADDEPPADEDCDISTVLPADKATTSGPSSSNSKHGTTFSPDWTKRWTWLRLGEKESEGMFCSLCSKYKVYPKRGLAYWTRIGCKSFREESIKQHASSDLHKAAMQREVESLAAERSGGIAASLQKAVTVQRSAFLAAMRVMYWLIKNDVPHTTNFASLLDLGKDLGCSYLNVLNVDSRTNYTSEQTMQELVLCLGSVIREERMLDITGSPFFALLCDETTDVAVLEQLIIYMKYLKDGKPAVSFVGIEEIPNQTAETIFNTLVGFAEKKNLDLVNQLASFGSDGGAQMVGRLNGVAAKLKRDYPIVTSNHCVAHRLALAVGAAASRVDYVKRFNGTLENLYQFYDNSPVRMAALKQIQEANEEAQLRPKKARTTRWLSHEQACETLARILPSVIMSLHREGQERNDPKAIGLQRQVETWNFVACLNMMLDILPQLSILSKCFQTKALDFTLVRQQVETTLEVLRNRLHNPGPHFQKIGTGEAFDNLEINADGGSLETFQRNIYRPFISAVCDNLEERFPDVSILQALCVFDPKKVPRTMEDSDDYGEENIGELATQYAQVVDEEACLTEWRSLRSLMITQDLGYGLQDMMQHLTTTYAEVYPNLAKIAGAALVIPASTADCERGFSTMKRVKTRLRNRLSAKVLNALMFISIEGPEKLSDQQLDKAVDEWSKIRNRRILLD